MRWISCRLFLVFTLQILMTEGFSSFRPISTKFGNNHQGGELLYQRNLNVMNFRRSRRLRRKFSEYRRSNKRRSVSTVPNVDTPEKKKKWLGFLLKNSKGVINKAINRNNWGKGMLQNSPRDDLQIDVLQPTSFEQQFISYNDIDMIERRYEFASMTSIPTKDFVYSPRNDTNMESAMFLPFDDQALMMNDPSQIESLSYQPKRTRNSSLSELLSLKSLGFTYGILMILLGNIPDHEDPLGTTENISDNLIEAIIPLSPIGWIALIVGEGVGWIFEFVLYKLYARNVNQSFSRSLDYDLVEAFADLFKWSLFDSIALPYGSFAPIFGNELLDHEYVQKALIGVVAGPASLLFGDSLRKTFVIGDKDMIKEIEVRTFKEYTLVYSSKLMATALLFGLYQYVLDETNLLS